MFILFWNIVHRYGHLILNTLSLKLNMFRDIYKKIERLLEHAL